MPEIKPEPKKIKIKKLSTGIVLTGIIDGEKICERFVKAGEEVTVWDWVLPKLDAIKEEYEVIEEKKPSPPVKDKVGTSAGRTE